MDIRITGKGLAVTEGIREWVFRKVSKLEKYAPRLVESHAILKREKYFYVAELTLVAKHLYIYGEGRDKDNVYTAIDLACARVAKQLRKFREKIKGHYQSKKGRGRAERSLSAATEGDG